MFSHVFHKKSIRKKLLYLSITKIQQLIAFSIHFSMFIKRRQFTINGMETSKHRKENNTPILLITPHTHWHSSTYGDVKKKKKKKMVHSCIKDNCSHRASPPPVQADTHGAYINTLDTSASPSMRAHTDMGKQTSRLSWVEDVWLVSVMAFVWEGKHKMGFLSLETAQHYVVRYR